MPTDPSRKVLSSILMLEQFKRLITLFRPVNSTLLMVLLDVETRAIFWGLSFSIVMFLHRNNTMYAASEGTTASLTSVQ